MFLKKKGIITLLVVLLVATQVIGVFANDSFVTLRFGSRGSEVVRLQQSLKDKGYFRSNTTGYYGEITQNAVISFQRDNRLTVDGIAGRQTQTALYASPTTTTSQASATTVLKFGSRGNDVVRLQQALKDRGYFQGNTTGYYGELTQRAVINFQRDNKLVVDGIAGRQTQTALYSQTATAVSRGTTTARNFSSDDLYWLSRIINAEASGEPYQGQVAVGNVVLNRVSSKDFPNSVYGVIFEYYKNIPQFSPVAEGTIHNTPSPSSVRAAEEALRGSRPVGDATYFFNPDKAVGTWIVRNKTYVTRIGGHVFYR
ncbi:peptidoglycan-binding protein [Serpentinicella alkaliphila]|uniref:N-acetylmuramoyl-L-alanine amidase n=1 Tax=Serpentinicella alkaliphila TaxID=1734049 RepID=A0A4R2TEM4_9FIRM|nr:peptidoglycan-binding protein [Serpentinicella alkaliphila]QUH27026.1 peptidoglycan-binding protein [Serpentinicella alkaliphila]TCQ01521.1 N-acetylmuramoyl-L-alanine amidase [Serpentinicella alkaliphila]